jgi:hypothetical protein
MVGSVSQSSQVPEGEPQRVEGSFVAKTYEKPLPSSLQTGESGKVSVSKSTGWLPQVSSESEDLRNHTISGGIMLAFAAIYQKLLGR